MTPSELRGFDPDTSNVKAEDRALLEDWGKVARRNGGKPTFHGYWRKGKHDPTTLQKRFGRWSAIPEAFRKFARGKPEWADVLGLLPVPKRKRTPEGKRDSAPAGSPNTVQNRRLANRPFYGNPTNFHALRHEPVNEQGVVLLFGMLAKELASWSKPFKRDFLTARPSGKSVPIDGSA